MSFSISDFHKYAETYSNPETPLLTTIREETYAQISGSNMLSGHLQGQVLATFSRMIKPNRILEIGTYTGYSALCLAEGLAKDGVLYTVDSNVLLEEKVRKYFKNSNKNHQIHYYIGKAIEIVAQIPEKFDLIFIDADKKNYTNYYELALEKLNSNGFIIIDNVLWKGKVLEKESENILDKHTQIMIDFNNKVHNDSRTINVLFPIRDGLMVVTKK